MRLRIIAYGVAVLVILAGVSIATFWAIGRSSARRSHAVSDSFARTLAKADEPTRQRLLDEALETGVEVSMYGPDEALLATNVRPPVPARPTVPRPPPLPLEDDARLDGPGVPLPPPLLFDEDDRREGPPGVARPPPLQGAGRRVQAIRTPPSIVPFPEPGRTSPDTFVFSGVQVVMRPAEPSTPLAAFAVPLLVTMAGLVLLSFPVTTAMTRKLDALADAACQFGKGDLSRRADASGSDEVSRTAQAFNTMAERIAELRLRERELFANVSHELRTPMARMAVLLELVESNPAEATRYVGELARDLRELESLLDSVIETFRLDLASPRAREPWPMHRVALDLRDVAREIASDFRVRAPGHSLTVELAPVSVVRDVDRTLVRRAVMNLLDNARKYSPPGSEIRLAVESNGDILVSDRGQGIDSADLPHVFEPFFRADRSRTRATGGVGLGLTFVKLVATVHGGGVSVESDPGAGSRFRLALG